MLRTTNPQHSLWEALLPEPCLRLPAELARVDTLLDDPAFLAPLAAHFDPRIGRPSVPLDTYLRMMFLKFRYRLGDELLCREVADSISWQRFCRIPLGAQVPHPTTLVKLTRRLGEQTVAGLNEALLATAAEHKVLRTHRVRADTTVIAANVAYPTDAGLLARAIGKLTATIGRIHTAGRGRPHQGPGPPPLRPPPRPPARQDPARPHRAGQAGGVAYQRGAGRPRRAGDG